MYFEEVIFYSSPSSENFPGNRQVPLRKITHHGKFTDGKVPPRELYITHYSINNFNCKKNPFLLFFVVRAKSFFLSTDYPAAHRTKVHPVSFKARSWLSFSDWIFHSRLHQNNFPSNLKPYAWKDF